MNPDSLALVYGRISTNLAYIGAFYSGAIDAAAARERERAFWLAALEEYRAERWGDLAGRLDRAGYRDLAAKLREEVGRERS